MKLPKLKTILIAFLLILSITLYVKRDYFYYKFKTGAVTLQEAKEYLIDNKYSPLSLKISNSLKEELMKSSNKEHDQFFTRSNPDKRLIVINVNRGLGDLFTAYRLFSAIENLGWDAVLIGQKHYTPRSYEIHKTITSFLQPDFVISQSPNIIIPNIKHYIICHVLEDNAADQIAKGDSHLFTELLPYDGVLGSFGDNQFLKPLNDFLLANNKPLHYLAFFLSVSRKNTEFQQIDYSKLFYCGDNWDALRGGEKYNRLYAMLEKKNYINIYGPKKKWKNYSKAYKGFLPYNVNLFLQAMRDSGISLVLHSNHHFANNIPSSRIFEAAAASTIIISDQLQFVKDNFADNVLYIDSSKTAEEIFTQIENHLIWIKEHPNQTRFKAENSNRIFREHFYLEKYLLKLDELNNKLKKL